MQLTTPPGQRGKADHANSPGMTGHMQPYDGSMAQSQQPSSTIKHVQTLAKGALRQAHDALDGLMADEASIERIAQVAAIIGQCYRQGGKVLACGNGGSACDAMHVCEELTGRFREDRPALAAIACIDPGHLTCTANDYGYDEVFARWIRGLGRQGDCVLLLSTSGNSANVVRAAKAARELGIVCVGLTGNQRGTPAGGQLASLCDHVWVVPGHTADRIQELHMLILHTLIECIEADMHQHGAW